MIYYGNKTMIPQAAIATGDASVYGVTANLAFGDIVVTSGHKQLLIGDDNYEATVPRKRVVNVTGDYYFRKIDDVVVADASAGAISVYLPSGATGLCATVIKSDGSANAVNILVSGSGQLLNGGYSISLFGSGDFIEVVNGGNPYYQTSRQYLVPTGTETGVLNQYRPVGYLLYDTEQNRLVLSVGEQSGKYRLDWPLSHITGVNMGPQWLETNMRGYGLGYVTDKLLANIKIGDSSISGEGALRFRDGALQLFANGVWNDSVIGFRFREDSTGNYELEHKPIGFDTWLNVREGTNNEFGPDGLPLVRGYYTNIGPYGQDLVIDGGDGR